MKKILFALLGLFLTAAISSSRADVAVEGRSPSGLPGQRVFLELMIDYGNEFRLIAEEFHIGFPQDVLSFVREASTIDLAGQGRTIEQYKTFLAGGVLDNLETGYYSFSYFTTTPQVRRLNAQIRLAFDILPSAKPGRYDVPVTGLFADESDCCDLPAELQSLSVNVLAVPEPQMALMLLPGLALVAFYARRRRAQGLR